ncbi:hypothetical protein Tco_1532177 [Tanacetum coccineum]
MDDAHEGFIGLFAEVFGIDVRMTQSQSTESTQVPVPTVDKADEMILQDILHVSLAKHKSQKEQEAMTVNVIWFIQALSVLGELERCGRIKKVIDDSLPPRDMIEH